MEQAAEKLLPAGAIYFMMSEDDVRRVLSYPHTMIGSDGLPHDQHPHPRLWGTFPRVLGHYVRDVKLFPLEEAVRRMTALPAAQFGLKDRGMLAPRRLCRSGAVRSRDDRRHGDLRAAEDAGRRHRMVLVNGRAVWSDGARPASARAARCGASSSDRWAAACRSTDFAERMAQDLLGIAPSQDGRQFDEARYSHRDVPLRFWRSRRPRSATPRATIRTVRRRSSCRSRRAATPTS